MELAQGLKRCVHVLLILFIELFRFGHTFHILLVGLSYLVLHLGIVKHVLDVHSEILHKTEHRVLAVVHVGKELRTPRVCGKHVGHGFLPALIAVKVVLVLVVIIGNLTVDFLIVLELLVGVFLSQPLQLLVASALNSIVFSHYLNFLMVV